MADAGIDALEELPDPTRAVTVQRIGVQATRGANDQVAVETPIALVFNGVSHAVMMATPADLEAFAMGFALSEGLLAAKGECRGIEVITGCDGLEVQLDVASAVDARLKERRRTLAGRTGCGLCGIDSLKQLDLQPEAVSLPAWLAGLQPSTVLQAFAQLPDRQPLNAVTGAHHAAAWVTPHGEVMQVMEDVGRHNALDKLLGWRALAGQRFDDGFVVMSSRASYELVRKCARLGVPLLATISAPTSLAIDIARESGVHLYGFCRGDRAVRYAPAAA